MRLWKLTANGRAYTTMDRTPGRPAGRRRGRIALSLAAAAAFVGVGLVLVVPSSAGAATGGEAQFAYTGSNQTFAVPAGVTALVVDAIGASGGPGAGGVGDAGGAPGNGGVVTVQIKVTPGEVIDVEVGGQGGGGGGVGSNGGNGGSIGGSYGAPGGHGGDGDPLSGDGGGGGAPTLLATAAQTALVVAGGGGGGGGGGAAPTYNGGNGGSGGTPPGGPGTAGVGVGAGGGGPAGVHASVAGASGGAPPALSGGGGAGGGGGGFNSVKINDAYGGGGLAGNPGGFGEGGGGGGGSGSSYVANPLDTPTFTTASTSGNGSVLIFWSAPVPTITVGSSANPVSGTVTFTATVTPPVGVSAEPTGPVYFDVDSKEVGQASLSGTSPDVARLATSSLTAGTHPVVAVYQGDSVFVGASSSTLTQSVIGSTALTLTASPNPVFTSQTLDLVATVTPSPPGGPVPTGPISFCTEGKCLTAALNGAKPDVATLVTTPAAYGFAPGSRTIIATYAGNSIYTSSGDDTTFGVASPAALAIGTTTLGQATAGSAYSATLAATGGVAPYRWSISSGSLPAGLTLNSTSGAITGMPTVAGTASLTVKVTDSAIPTATTATKALTLTVAPPPLTVTTATLPTATAGAPYDTTLAGTGGTKPYRWSISSGSLPAGLTLNPTAGTITGTPTAPGTASLTLKITDSTTPTAVTASHAVSLIVQPAIVPAVYVVNGGYSGLESFTLGSAGDATPHTDITGTATGLNGTTGIAIDTTGRLYVTNGDADTVTEYPNQTTGNTAPIANISGPVTGLSEPDADTIDGNGRLYVANDATSTITVYASGATGNAAPVATIGGPGTGLSGPAAVTVDPAGHLWVANANNTLTEYATGATGNATPLATITGSGTGLNGPQGLTIDGEGNLLVANTYGPSLTEYPPTANGDVTPLRTITGTALDFPVGVDVDTAGNIYVSNQFGNSITEYPPTATGNATPTAVISGSATGLSAPGHLAVAPPLSVLTTSLPDGLTGHPYTATLAAGLGTPPYRWTVSQGHLPSGLRLDPVSGTLAGRPIAAGLYRFTIEVTDSARLHMTATQDFALRINPDPHPTTHPLKGPRHERHHHS